MLPLNEAVLADPVGLLLQPRGSHSAGGSNSLRSSCFGCTCKKGCGFADMLDMFLPGCGLMLHRHPFRPDFVQPVMG